MTEHEIAELLKRTKEWTYGLNCTVFYWPITASGRYEGVLYTKGDYLTLQVYEKTITETVNEDAISKVTDFDT